MNSRNRNRTLVDRWLTMPLLFGTLGLSIQADMTYRPWSLEGDIIEARALVDLTQTLDVGLAWRRGKNQLCAVARADRLVAESLACVDVYLTAP